MQDKGQDFHLAPRGRSVTLLEQHLPESTGSDRTGRACWEVYAGLELLCWSGRESGNGFFTLYLALNHSSPQQIHDLTALRRALGHKCPGLEDVGLMQWAQLVASEAKPGRPHLLSVGCCMADAVVNN